MLVLKSLLQTFYYKKLTKIKQEKMFEPIEHRSLKSSIFINIFKTIILIFFGIIVIFPFYFMISTALLSIQEVTGNSIPLSPNSPQWSNFSNVITTGSYWIAIGITAFITFVSVLARLFFSMTLGYVFSLKNWRFKTAIWWFLLALLVLPESALLIGQYRIVVQLGWKASSWVLVSMFLPFVASTFSSFMYKNAFSSISDYTKEAAMIDGLGPVSFFFKLALPMVKTTTVTVIILTAFASWNSFTWPQLLLAGNEFSSELKDIQTITTWLFITGLDQNDPDAQRVFINLRMAGAILALLPMFITYILFRKRMIKVISRQTFSVKG